jgi:uncharacterized protein YbjT (DUF2867 family)
VEAVKVEDAFKEPVDRLYLTSTVTRDQFLVETDLIIAARKAGVKYIVKLATVDAWMEVYCEAFYPRSHLAVELFLERGDIPFTCLRANLFHNFVPGLDLDSARKTHQYRSILNGASVACIDPADVGRAAAALLDLDDPSAHYGKKYMLTGPEDVNDQRFASLTSLTLPRVQLSCNLLDSSTSIDRSALARRSGRRSRPTFSSAEL